MVCFCQIFYNAWGTSFLRPYILLYVVNGQGELILDVLKDRGELSKLKELRGQMEHVVELRDT